MVVLEYRTGAPRGLQLVLGVFKQYFFFKLGIASKFVKITLKGTMEDLRTSERGLRINHQNQHFLITPLLGGFGRADGCFGM